MSPKNHVDPFGEAIERAKVEWNSVGNYTAASLPKRTFSEELSLSLRNIGDSVVFLFGSLLLIAISIVKLILPQPKKSIQGEVVVVTGGANGLGKALATELIQHGARVAIVDMDGIAAMDTVSSLRKMVDGSDGVLKANGYMIDVSDPDQVRRLRELVARDFGEPASTIVNNAGLIPVASLTGGTNDDIRRVMDVNCNSQFWMIREFLPAMKERNHGHILTISSLSAETGLSRAVVYAATKAAIKCMSMSLQDELEDDGFDGIKVSIAYPYFIATRKTLVDVIKMRFPPVSPEFAAKAIIRGMLKDKLHIGVPSMSLRGVLLMRAGPDSLMRLLRRTFKIEIPKINQ